jgi:hypothetical protein
MCALRCGTRHPHMLRGQRRCVCLLVAFVLLYVCCALILVWPLYPDSSADGKLDAYYQCFARVRANAEVLRRFRTFYPAAQISMVNDGGDPVLSMLARKFHAHYAYANRTSMVTHGMYFTSWQKGAAYLKRIIRASETCEWLLLLEDDVWVLSRIPLQTLRCDVNGAYAELRLPDGLMDVIRRYSDAAPKARLQYAGNGGSILRCSFFRGLQLANQTDILRALFEARGGYIASDELLSSFAYVHRGNICTYPSYAEPMFFTFLFGYLTGSISVLHNAKFMYEYT